MPPKGVKFVCAYYAFGEFDLCFIVEGPDNVKTASVLIVAAGGSISRIQKTVLMTAEEGLEAIKDTAGVGYKPPGSRKNHHGTVPQPV